MRRAESFKPSLASLGAWATESKRLRHTRTDENQATRAKAKAKRRQRRRSRRRSR